MLNSIIVFVFIVQQFFKFSNTFESEGRRLPAPTMAMVGALKHGDNVKRVQKEELKFGEREKARVMRAYASFLCVLLPALLWGQFWTPGMGAN